MSTRVLNDGDRPWLPLDGSGKNFLKIIQVNDALNQVVLMLKLGPNAIYPQHSHCATAIAFTVEGEWEYAEGVLRKGSVALEPPGSDHTPLVSDKGTLVFAVLTGTDENIAEMPMPDGTVLKQNMSYWRELYNLTADEAAARSSVGGVSIGSRL